MELTVFCRQENFESEPDSPGCDGLFPGSLAAGGTMDTVLREAEWESEQDAMKRKNREMDVRHFISRDINRKKKSFKKLR